MIGAVLSPPSRPRERTVIAPSRGWVAIDWRELHRYRELLYFLVWRDIKVRYRQTLLGATWALLQPVITMVLFTLVFGRLAKVPSEGVPYPLFALAALVPWQLLASGLGQSANSLVASANLVRKVYFPRLLVPASSVLASLVDCALALSFVLALLPVFGRLPPLHLLAVPLFVLLALISALAVGTWLAALNAQYRDVRYLIPLLTQIWLFATPIAYPLRLVPDRWRTLYALNPMVGAVEGFRWCLLDTPPPSATTTLASAAMALVLLATGVVYFRRVERFLADVV